MEKKRRNEESGVKDEKGGKVGRQGMGGSGKGIEAS